MRYALSGSVIETVSSIFLAGLLANDVQQLGRLPEFVIIFVVIQYNLKDFKILPWLNVIPERPIESHTASALSIGHHNHTVPHHFHLIPHLNKFLLLESFL
jgi:hypothetical protein